MAVRGEFLALLTDDDRRDFEAIVHRQSAARGEVLIARGDVMDSVMVVESGRVKVCVTTSTGREAVLTFRGPGTLLGELALVDEAPRSASVIAVEPVEVLVVAGSSFRTFLGARPRVTLAILATLSARLR